MPRKLARRQSVDPAPESEEVEIEETATEWRPTPLLYDVTDTCFILGKISKQMLYRLIHLKLIRPVKIGTRSLFTMAEMERFVQEREQESATG